MSMGGCYVSINKTKLNSILNNDESLQDYVDSLPDSETHSLEQAWDAINSILKQDVPSILGEQILEDVDLGEECHIIDTNDKNIIVEQLKLINKDKLIQIRNSPWFQNEDFYWNNVYKNNDELIDEVLSLKEFMLLESHKKDNILLFWVC